MSEILFYHLQRQNLEQILPRLLEKCLDRGWRALVRGLEPARIAALDAMLWSCSQENFLPHSRERDGREAQQPIFLSTDNDNPNNADVLFAIEGAKVEDASDFLRTVYLFDGNDEAAVTSARALWKDLSGGNLKGTYWQQDAAGQWQAQS